MASPPLYKKNSAAHTTLVIGGARSGKSRFAEEYLLKEIPHTDYPCLYIATAQAYDAEMHYRIEQHQKRRPPQKWLTIEAPTALAQTLQRHNQTPALIDCLTLWLTNLFMGEKNIEQEIKELTNVLEHRQAMTLCVSSEIGLGIVPQTPFARQFRDNAGYLNQTIATVAQHVFFIAAGLPLTLK